MKYYFDIIVKIIKKLHLNNVFYNIAKQLIHYKRIELNIEDAEKIIEKYQPDCGKSALVNKRTFDKKYDLDIIVPAYNAEKYISDCIESILSQETEYRYRIILIDDGSTDNTGTIIDQYENSNIFVIHQENKGYSGARNAGISMVAARYIMFVDADDVLERGAIQQLLKHAIDNNMDIVEGGYFKLYASGKIKNTVYANKDAYAASLLRGFPCMKVYRSCLFSEIQFPEGYWYEDTIMHTLIYPKARKLCTIDDIVYGYRDNYEGISRTSYRYKKCIDSYYIAKQTYYDRLKLGEHNNLDYYNWLLQMIKLTYQRTRFQPKEIRTALFVLFSEWIKRDFQEFNTDKTELKELEVSLKNSNYSMYELYCILI